MKNRNSIYKNLQGVSMGIMAACLALTACDKDKEFTPAMPEAKLINSITFDVSPTLPLAIGMDSMIVCKVEAPEELEDRTILWRSTDEAVAACVSRRYNYRRGGRYGGYQCHSSYRFWGYGFGDCHCDSSNY